MDRYVVLTSLSDQFAANQVCSALEHQGIPVIIEHLLVNGDGVTGNGFRVLVPSHQAQRGLRLVGSLGYANAANEEDAATSVAA